MIQFNENPYTWSDTSSGVNTAATELTLRSDANVIEISNLTTPLEMSIPHTVAPGNDSVTANITSTQTAIVEISINDTENTLVVLVDISSVFNDEESTDQRTEESSGQNGTLDFEILLISDENITDFDVSNVNSSDLLLAIPGENGTVTNYTTTVVFSDAVTIR